MRASRSYVRVRALGAQLRLWRQAGQLTQVEVAEMLGVSQSLVSYLERGGHDVSFGVALKVWDLLDLVPGAGRAVRGGGVAWRLFDARVRRGWSQDEVARRARVDVGDVVRVERRAQAVRYSFVMAIARALAIDVVALCDGGVPRSRRRALRKRRGAAPRVRRSFSAQDKHEAVVAVASAESVATVARRLGIHRQVLHRWVADHADNGSSCCRKTASTSRA